MIPVPRSMHIRIENFTGLYLFDSMVRVKFIYQALLVIIPPVAVAACVLPQQVPSATLFRLQTGTAQHRI